MKNKFLNRILLLVSVIGFINFTANATDGYFSTGYGTINKGLAGAGIAYYQGSLINGNPAAVVHLGTRYHIGVDFFNPNRSFTISGSPSFPPPAGFGLQPGSSESGSKYFIIPSLGANWMINDVSSFSVALFGNGGMNTTFPAGGFYDVGSEFTGVDLGQLFANLSYSIMITENHSLGVTATLGFQYFEADGLAPFAGFTTPENADKVSGNGKSNSFGYGFKVGYLGKLTENISIGATYQSKVFMSQFEEYAGLFAENGDFDIPSSWTVGFSWDVTDVLTLMGDYKRINYTDVKSVSNPMLTGNTFNAPLGSASGAGFGWSDINIIKVGASYSGVDYWTFRGGVSLGDNPISEEDVLFNILAPGVITTQLSAGITRDLVKKKRGRRYKQGDEGKQLHLAVNYALENTISGVNLMDGPTSSQMIEIGMNQIELEIGFSF